MTQTPFSKADLNQFTGTEQWFRHSFVPGVLYTDGVQYLARNAGAYWLIDEIALAQRFPAAAMPEFQVWKLAVHPDHSALRTCEDGNSNQCLAKGIEYTDFPLEHIELYFTGGVILLPGEY